MDVIKEITYREMVEDDIPSVVTIEEESFHSSVDTGNL